MGLNDHPQKMTERLNDRCGIPRMFGVQVQVSDPNTPWDWHICHPIDPPKTTPMEAYMAVPWSVWEMCFLWFGSCPIFYRTYRILWWGPGAPRIAPNSAPSESARIAIGENPQFLVPDHTSKIRSTVAHVPRSTPKTPSFLLPHR